MKIIIAEAGSAANIGSMALIENAIRIARKLDSECNITVLSSDPQSVSDELMAMGMHNKVSVKYDLFKIPSKSGMLPKVFWLVKTVIWILVMRIAFLFTKKPFQICGGRKMGVLREVAQSDYVLCIGAERINDIYYKTAYLSLEALSIYIKEGAKLVHLSLTIGPVFYKSTINKAAKVLNDSYAIFVRDSKSYELLKELKVKKPYCFNSFDIAILQEKSKNGDELMKEFGINGDFVCVSSICWSFRKAKGPARQPEYNEALACTLDYIVEKYNLNIVFTPTVVGIYKVDDVTASKDIVKLMKHKDHVVIIKRLLPPSDLAAIFSKSRFAIVTRMHAAILCSGAGGRPIIAINYLYKLREYMKNIGFEDYSVDIDYVNQKDLIAFVNRMVEEYGKNVERLNEKMRSMKENLCENIKLICK